MSGFTRKELVDEAELSAHSAYAGTRAQLIKMEILRIIRTVPDEDITNFRGEI